MFSTSQSKQCHNGDICTLLSVQVFLQVQKNEVAGSQDTGTQNLMTTEKLGSTAADPIYSPSSVYESVSHSIHTLQIFVILVGEKGYLIVALILSFSSLYFFY